MDRIISSISEIEGDSVRIMEEANTKKAEIFAQIQKETEAYDREIEGKTEERIAVLRSQLEKEMYDKLTRQKEAADSSLKALEQHYEANHADYVDELFKMMTGV